MSLSPSLITLLNDLRAAGVAILDVNGNQLSGFDSSRPSTAATTFVLQTNASQVLLPANLARRRVRIINTGNKTAYVAYGATAAISNGNYGIIIASGQDYEGPLNDYTGEFAIIWSAAGPGAAIITEITT